MNGISQWDWPREESRPNSPAKHLKAEYYSRKKKEEKFQALNPSNGQFKRQNRTLSKIPGQQQTRVLGIEAGKNARVHLLIFSQDPNLIPKLTNFPPKKKRLDPISQPQIRDYKPSSNRQNGKNTTINNIQNFKFNSGKQTNKRTNKQTNNILSFTFTTPHVPKKKVTFNRARAAKITKSKRSCHYPTTQTKINPPTTLALSPNPNELGLRRTRTRRASRYQHPPLIQSSKNLPRPQEQAGELGKSSERESLSAAEAIGRRCRTRRDEEEEEEEEKRRRRGRSRSSANPDANHHPVAGQGRDTQLNKAATLHCSHSTAKHGAGWMHSPETD